MKNVLAFALTVLTMSSAFAQQLQQPDIRERQRETGAFSVIEDSVGQCSASSILPMLDLLGNATAKSEFDYVVCKEIETYQVAVSGKFWNTNEAPIAGSEKKSYVLERKKGGLSQVVYGQLVNPNDPQSGRQVDMFQFMQASNAVRTACTAQRSALSQSQRPKSQTPCANQVLR